MKTLAEKQSSYYFIHSLLHYRYLVAINWRYSISSVLFKKAGKSLNFKLK